VDIAAVHRAVAVADTAIRAKSMGVEVSAAAVGIHIAAALQDIPAVEEHLTATRTYSAAAEIATEVAKVEVEESRQVGGEVEVLSHMASSAFVVAAADSHIDWKVVVTGIEAEELKPQVRLDKAHPVQPVPTERIYSYWGVKMQRATRCDTGRGIRDDRVAGAQTKFRRRSFVRGAMTEVTAQDHQMMRSFQLASRWRKDKAHCRRTPVRLATLVGLVLLLTRLCGWLERPHHQFWPSTYISATLTLPSRRRCAWRAARVRSRTGGCQLGC
jgi:hypothetical protein